MPRDGGDVCTVPHRCATCWLAPYARLRLAAVLVAPREVASTRNAGFAPVVAALCYEAGGKTHEGEAPGISVFCKDEHTQRPASQARLKRTCV